MLVAKLMSSEDLPDSNNSKDFTLVESHGLIDCVRDKDGKGTIVVIDEWGEEREYPMNGNAYILQDGKTIAAYACHQHG